MAPVILHREEHPISRKNIDKHALKVLYRLRKYGYTAYLVGGSVRDLLIGRKPKDFDVVTNARPNKVRKLFRNAFLVGRRFRLVHVKFGDTIIEVSTFRRTPQRESEDSDLLLLRENTFGTPEEDALRRDFTINGLFYNISDFSIIDHVGGLEDIKNKIVRTIGNPRIRLREDPARMIRAIRVAGRLNFRIHEDVWNVINEYRDEVLRCAPSRLLEEIYHLMKHGAAGRTMRLLHKSRLMETLIPSLSKFWDHHPESRSAYFLDQIDKIPGDHPFRTNALIMAALFFPMIYVKSKNLKPGEDLYQRVESCVRPFAKQYNMPKRQYDRMIQICIAQRWFYNQKKSRRFRPMSLIKRNFFGETLTFVLFQMNANPDVWKVETQKWRNRILQADISDEYRKNLLYALDFSEFLHAGKKGRGKSPKKT